MKQGETLALNERIMLSLVSTGHDCPFIVCMTYAFHTQDKLCFILDLMNGGDLHYHLSQVPSVPSPPPSSSTTLIVCSEFERFYQFLKLARYLLQNLNSFLFDVGRSILKTILKEDYGESALLFWYWSILADRNQM